MATLVLGAVGAGIGAAFGNPMLGFSIGTSLAGVLFPPRMRGQEMGRLDDLKAVGASYGTMIPQLWGTVRVGGNVIWSTDLIEKKTKKKAEGSKGGGGAETTVYTYSVSCAVAVCRGPVQRIKRIWAEDVLLYDVDNTKPPKHEFRIYTGTEDQEPDTLIESLEGVGEVPAYRGLCYVVFEQLKLRKWGNRIPAFTFEVETADSVTVGDILADLASQCGIAPTACDFSAATSPVTGFVLAQRAAGREAVEHLATAYATDVVEVDGQLRAVQRGSAEAVAVPRDDLGATVWGAGDRPARLGVKRLQELELPARVDVTYLNAARDYDQATQGATRITKAGILQEALTITLPLVLTDDQARQVAEMALYERWTERETATFTLPLSYLQYCPGDAFLVPTESGDVRRYRIVDQLAGPIGPVQFTGVLEDPTIYDQTALGGSSPDTPDTYDEADATNLFAWSGNALTDEQAETVGFYAVATSTSDLWPGCQIFWSKNGGQSYTAIASIDDQSAHGTTLDALPAGLSTGVWDRSTTLTVEMAHGAPESTSEADVLDGANAALVGNEVIQFATVEPLGGNQYRLSNLLRGRRGTDGHWSGHVAGERFVMLDGPVVYVPVPKRLHGKEILLKGVTIDTNLNDATPVAVTITGDEFKCYAPCHVAGSRDGGGNLAITWIRRTRAEGGLQDLLDVPLLEDSEAYELDILDGAGAVVRTLTSSTASATYTAAQQTADFGSPQPAVTVRVYQIGKYGRGYPADATL